MSIYHTLCGCPKPQLAFAAACNCPQADDLARVHTENNKNRNANRFHENGAATQSPVPVIAASLTEAQKKEAELRKHFEKYDADNSGWVRCRCSDTVVVA